MISLRAQLLCLVAILGAAFGLRVRGIGHQVPQWTYRDGFVVRVQAQHLREPGSVARPDAFLGFYPYATAAAAAALPEVPAERASDGAAAAELERAREPWVRIRLASILLSLGAVVGAWGIARRFMGPGWALLAAALVATSLVHVTYSAEQRPHGPASGAVALATWALLALRAGGGARTQLVAAAAVGAAVATLQSGLALVVPWALAWTWRSERGSRARELALAAASVAIVAAAFRLAYPFHFDGRAGTAAEFETGAETLWMGGHALYVERFGGRGFGVMAKTFAAFDPVLSAFAALGLAIVVARRAMGSASEVPAIRDAWICVGFVVPFVVVFGVYDMTYDRFVLPLVPFAAVAAAYAAFFVSRALAPGSRVAVAAVATLALAFPGAVASKLAELRAAPDTFERAAGWIEENVDPADRVLLLQNFDLPLAYEREALAELNDSLTLDWTRFQRGRPVGDAPAFRIARPPRAAEAEDAPGEFLDAAELRARGFRWVVSMLPKRGGIHDEEAVGALKALRREMERVASFAPRDEDDDLEREAGTRRGKRPQVPDFGFGVTESATAWSVLMSRSIGPRIEIFRLDAPRERGSGSR